MPIEQQSKQYESLSEQARRGVFWYVLKTLGSQTSRFITSIILARILFPEDFGIMGMVFVVTRLAQRVGEFGFSQVIIQINEITEDHIKTTFTLNLFFSVFITGFIFVFAPQLASLVMRQQDAHLMPKVIDILRVISFNFILSGLYTIPNALIRRDMKFKQDSLVGLLAGMINFLTPIPLALAGFGVWSIVFGAILGQVVQVVGFYLMTHWKPRLGLNKYVLKDILSFGAWMNIYGYVNYAINNIDYFMISKFLGAAQLGYYERAYNLMNAPRKRISNMIETVLFSTYSRIQNQDERLNNAFNKVMKSVTLVSFPVMIWLFFAAPSFIVLLYGKRWWPTIVPTQIMCFSGLLSSVAMVFDPVFIAKGLVKQRTKAYVIKLIVLAIGVVWGVKNGINYVAIAIAVAAFFSLFFNTWFYQQYTSWQWTTIWSNLKPALITSGIILVLLIPGRSIVLINNTNHSLVMLCVVSLISVLGYIITAYLFKFPEMAELLNNTAGGFYRWVKHMFKTEN